MFKQLIKKFSYNHFVVVIGQPSVKCKAIIGHKIFVYANSAARISVVSNGTAPAYIDVKFLYRSHPCAERAVYLVQTV